MASTQFLTPKTQDLLEEIHCLLAVDNTLTKSSESLSDPSDNHLNSNSNREQCEEFYKFCHEVERQHEFENRDLSYLTSWGWIFQHEELFRAVCQHLHTAATEMDSLEHRRLAVTQKCEVLHHNCEILLKEQHVLEEHTQSISNKLDKFDRINNIKKVLERGVAALSTGSTVTSLAGASTLADFPIIMDQLDESIEFLETHQDYVESRAYLQQYDALRLKACQMLKNHVIKGLTRTMDQVLEQVENRSKGYETSVFYVRFRAAAVTLKPLTTLLSDRLQNAEIYATTLLDLERHFANLRLRLVSGPLKTHMGNVIASHFAQEPAAAIRQVTDYVLKLCILEKQTFFSYFEARQPQDALENLIIKNFGNLLYDTIRPLIVSFNDIDTLREIADTLHLDILQPYGGLDWNRSSYSGYEGGLRAVERKELIKERDQDKSKDMLTLLSIVLRLYQDVQERLIFRIQTYVRDDIKGFRVSENRGNLKQVIKENDLLVKIEVLI